ncbi:hypothetical protein CTheo_9235 [Ceratobasidium theobromae]|uniref:Uncharacterized protein n=1 Tax=Ceratobasidium theobromae TaxID=1582974 RepID=A0A5N5Q7A0_9AGAM|nr:hypothetical protein CTheo_9235 [Ceratobasidium theobromae]
MLATKDGIQEETVAGAAEPATQETSVIPERSNPISQITTSGENTIPSLTPPSTQAQSTQGNDNVSQIQLHFSYSRVLRQCPC